MRSRPWAGTTRGKPARSSLSDMNTTQPRRPHYSISHRQARMVSLVALSIVLFTIATIRDSGAESLVIETSPSVKDAMAALGRGFETTHPHVTVQLSVDQAVDLRRTIAALENRGLLNTDSSPIHIVAPGGDELITRLENRQYILPMSRTVYATEQLVLIAHDASTDSPISFEALAQAESVRVAVADLTTQLGIETARLLSAVGFKDSQQIRLSHASTHTGVLDHVVAGNVTAGIVFGHQAYQSGLPLRIVAAAPPNLYRPIAHSMAVQRHCPNRQLCQEFLRFATSFEGQLILKQLGYGPGK